MISLHVILTGFDKHILLPEQEKQFKKREKLLTKDEWYTLFSKVLYSVIVYITCGAHTYLILYSTIDLLCIVHASAIQGAEKMVDHGKQLIPF